ncbi:alpha/beta fold hydrolase [Paraherbaspirillum soli]|uniref:Alpha/beta fold hydrolase n=1 Tax=Paraherbaspirillum soli TaxID=631222 RepID=A0ABW0MFC8_9BURK
MNNPITASIKQVSVNGVSLPFLEQGQGTPVVFVHGYISDHRVWRGQRQAVAQRYRYIAFSQRYFGANPWRDGGDKFSFATHLDDLAAFIRGLHAGPVHVVGWSYGAALGLVLAMQHPELVRSLFAYEPGSGTFVTDPVDAKTIAEDRQRMIAPAISANQAGQFARAVQFVFDSANHQAGLFETLAPPLRAVFLDNARTIPLLFGAPPPPSLSSAQLGRSSVPVAIARGELTRPFYRIVADTASRCIPGARLVVLPNGMHAAPVLTPAAFNQALLDFLRATETELSVADITTQEAI